MVKLINSVWTRCKADKKLSTYKKMQRDPVHKERHELIKDQIR